MKRNYKYGWEISREGFKAITMAYFTMEETYKSVYVSRYLHPSVHEANCGWYGISYCVCDIDGANRREFVLMYADKNDTPNNARWIDVTAESKGSIAEAVWSLVFA